MALGQDFEGRWTACEVASLIRMVIQRENVEKKSWRSVIRAPPNTTTPAMAPAIMPMIPRTFALDAAGTGVGLTVGAGRSVTAFCAAVCGTDVTISASSDGTFGVWVGAGVGVTPGVEAVVAAAATNKAVGVGVRVGVVVCVGIAVEVVVMVAVNV